MRLNDRKTLSYLAGAFLLILVGLFLFGLFPGRLVADGVKIYRFDYGKGPTDIGRFRIPFAKTSDNPAFRVVNVAVDLNSDGIIAPYDAGRGLQEEWLVRNMAAFPDTASSNSYPIRVPDGTVEDRLPLAATIVFTDRFIDAESWPESFPDGARVEDAPVEEIEIDYIGSAYSLDGEGKFNTGLPAPRVPVVVRPVSAQGSNVDFDSGESKEVRDVAQAFNECVPTSVANVMLELAERYGFEDRMPRTTEDLINELKGDMKWTFDGVPDEHILPGKRSFIGRRGLPLEAHMVSEQKFDEDILPKIAKELSGGQGIELTMEFFEVDMYGKVEIVGAHMASVARAASIDGTGFIALSDPATATESDDAGQDVYVVDGKEIKEYYADGMTLIDWAYAQSPVLDGAGQIVYLKPIAHIPGENSTVGVSKFDFFTVEVEQPGDHVLGEPFPVKAKVTWTGEKVEVEYWVEKEVKRNEKGQIESIEYEQKTYRHGAGKPWELWGSFLTEAGTPLSPGSQNDQPPRISIGQDSFEAAAVFTCIDIGRASVFYAASLDWPRDGEEPPQGLLDSPRSKRTPGEFSTSDELRIESPPFRCLPKEGDADTAQPPPPPPQPGPEPTVGSTSSDEARCKQVCGADRYSPAASIKECSDTSREFLCIQDKKACYDYLVPVGWQTDSKCCCKDAHVVRHAGARIDCKRFIGWDLNGFAVTRNAKYPVRSATLPASECE